MLKELCKKMLPRSLWVYHANSGGCNGCDIEVLNVLTPYYDAERFGIKLVGSPRHADVMLCQGPASRATAKALKRAYDAMPAPKLVFAIGSCACGGGIWYDTYNIIGPVEKVIPSITTSPAVRPGRKPSSGASPWPRAWSTRRPPRSGSSSSSSPSPRYHPEDLIEKDGMVVYQKMDHV